MLNRFAGELFVQNMIFDFATEYYWSHPQPPVLDSLKITGKDLDQFTNFLAGRKFAYRTESESILEELTKAATEEGLYDANREAMEKLKSGLSHTLEREIALYRPDVIELLESELAGRYFYDWGMVEYSVSRDTQIKKAIEIAGDRVQYASLLKAPAGI
jgi:carboxyl-terminal processing protease